MEAVSDRDQQAESGSINVLTVSADDQNDTAVTTVPCTECAHDDTVEVSMSTVAEIQSFKLDPALYAQKKLSAADITLCLEAGPSHPPESFVFPKTGGRSFQYEWFYRIIPHDSMRQCRQWLSYSMSTDRAFCLPCMLFGGPSASSTWSRDGWKDWRNGIRTIDQHEHRKEHKASEIARFHWISGRSLSRITMKPNNVVINDNRQVLSCIIDCVKYLAQEMMALRGHDSVGGKLLNLFRLLAKYHPTAAAYVQRLDQCKEDGRKMGTNFMSPANIQSLLTVIRQLILQQIVAQLHSHRKCTIIADGRYDSSKKEATVLLLHYVELGEARLPHPVEWFVDLFTSGDTSGAELCDHILKSLAEAGVDIQWVVGQGYDGAGNVHGNCQGLKTRIQKINIKAVYVWCYGHRFNLVIEATVACCPDVKNTLDLLEELYSFFSGHRHKRNSVFTGLRPS